MKLIDIANIEIYEIVYVDENDNILNEAAIRAFKRIDKKIVRKFRCISGKKKGKIVSSPGGCAKRKEPRRVRLGKKIARTRKGIRITKSKISNKKASHNLLVRLNKRFRIK